MCSRALSVFLLFVIFSGYISPFFENEAGAFTAGPVVTQIAAGSLALAAGSEAYGTVKAQISYAGQSDWFNLSLDNMTAATLVANYLNGYYSSSNSNAPSDSGVTTTVDWVNSTLPVAFDLDRGFVLFDNSPSVSSIADSSLVGSMSEPGAMDAYWQAATDEALTAFGASFGGKSRFVGVYPDYYAALDASIPYYSGASRSDAWPYVNSSKFWYQPAFDEYGLGYCAHSFYRYTNQGSIPFSVPYFRFVYVAQQLRCWDTADYTVAYGKIIAINEISFSYPDPTYSSSWISGPLDPPVPRVYISEDDTVPVLGTSINSAISDTDEVKRNQAKESIGATVKAALDAAATAGAYERDKGTIDSSTPRLVDSVVNAPVAIPSTSAKDLSDILSGSIPESVIQGLQAKADTAASNTDIPIEAPVADTTPLEVVAPISVTNSIESSGSFSARLELLKTRVSAAPILAVFKTGTQFAPASGTYDSKVNISIPFITTDDTGVDHPIVFDFAEYDVFFDYLRWVFLFIVGFFSIRVLFLKKG